MTEVIHFQKPEQPCFICYSATWLLLLICSLTRADKTLSKENETLHAGVLCVCMYLCEFFLAIVSLSQSQEDNLDLLILCLCLLNTGIQAGMHCPSLLVCKWCWRVNLTCCMHAPETETAKYSRKCMNQMT